MLRLDIETWSLNAHWESCYEGCPSAWCLCRCAPQTMHVSINESVIRVFLMHRLLTYAVVGTAPSSRASMIEMALWSFMVKSHVLLTRTRWEGKGGEGKLRIISAPCRSPEMRLSLVTWRDYYSACTHPARTGNCIRWPANYGRSVGISGFGEEMGLLSSW